jgi:DNA polymerase-3 subunit gamma/tau
MLLKGMNEVANASRPLAAAEMVLVRIAYAADLPTPDDVIRSLDNGAGEGASARPAGGNGNGHGATTTSAAPPSAPRYDAPRGAPRGSAMTAPMTAPMQNSVPAPRASADPAPAAPAMALGKFEDIVALAADKRDVAMKMALERDVRLVRCEDGRLEIALETTARPTLVNELSRKLGEWTGRRWMVVVSAEQGAPTLKVQAEAREVELKRGVRANPLVQSVLNKFPGAEIVGVTVHGESADEGAPADDMPPYDDEQD